MATNDCGCAGSSQNPPGTTSPTVNNPVGAVSSYGGTAMVPRGSCGPAACPQPPTSDAEERSPYCPGWPDRLTTSAFGRLIISIGTCLYALKSKCSGYLHFNASTEQVTVQNPPYVSSIPKETSFGFMAKVVPTPTTICVDGLDTCETEIRQELASQVLGESSCGRLMVAFPPICGDVPPVDSADLQKQVHIDYLEAPNHEDVGCPAEVRFLVMFPGTRGSGQNQVTCEQFAWMRRFKLRGSDWGMIPAGNPLETTGFVPILIPVAGGNEADPCFEMRMSSQKLGAGLPTSAENCDILIYKDKGLPTAGFKAVSEALGPQWLESNKTLNFGVTTALTDYGKYAAKGCKLSAIVQMSVVISGTSGQGGTLAYFANGRLGEEVSLSNGGSDAGGGQLLCPLTEDKITITRTGSFPGSITHNFALLGYFVS